MIMVGPLLYYNAVAVNVYESLASVANRTHTLIPGRTTGRADRTTSKIRVPFKF